MDWIILPVIEDVCSGIGRAPLYQKAEANEFDAIGLCENDRLGRDEDAVVAKVFRSNTRRFGKKICFVHQSVAIKIPELYKPYEDDSSLWLEAVSDTASSVTIHQFRSRHAFGMEKRITNKKRMTGSVPTGCSAERITLPNGKTMLGERTLDYVIVQRIYYESGSSYRAVAGSLNKDGLKTLKGNDWTESTIEEIINNPTYYGATIDGKDRSIGKPDAKYAGQRRTDNANQWKNG